MWFPNRSDTNRPVQAQKRARSLKFRIEVDEELYYPSSENKDADQLRGYHEADLRLCFRLCRLLVFPRGGSFITYYARHKTACIAKDATFGFKKTSDFYEAKTRHYSAAQYWNGSKS